MCHHRLSPGCSALNYITVLILCWWQLAQGTAPYPGMAKAIPTPLPAQWVIALSFQRQMHKDTDLPESQTGAEHLCKSVEIQDIIILTRHCPDCLCLGCPTVHGEGAQLPALFSLGNCVLPRGRIKCTCRDMVTLLLPDLIWVGNLSAEPVVNSLLHCLAESSGWCQVNRERMSVN